MATQAEWYQRLVNDPRVVDEMGRLHLLIMPPDMDINVFFQHLEDLVNVCALAASTPQR